jgi:DNA-binding CsgD family transcriptional regulator/tetratricopeptide (TPR) repeat protein
VLLFAARDGERRVFAADGLPGLTLAGLNAQAARSLLGENVAPDVAARLVESSGGNPLALLELPGSLSPEQLAGRAAVRGPLPVGPALERTFLERVRALPEDTQQLLLLAAAEESGDTATVARAAIALGLSESSLRPAEEAELLHVDDRIEFRHPVVRSAVYRGAGFTARRIAHEALANALVSEAVLDRRAWHRAAAAVGRDEEIAAELERSADRARRRSGHGAAAAALERAAELSHTDVERARRLAAAADAALKEGAPDRAVELGRRAAALTDDRRVGAGLALVEGTVELQRGSPSEAQAVLANAAASVADLDPELAFVLLGASVEAGAMAGWVRRAADFGRQVGERLPRGSSDEQRFVLAFIEGIAKVTGPMPSEAVGPLREAVEIGEDFRAPRLISLAGAAAAFLGNERRTRDFMQRAIDVARATGAVGDLPRALLVQGHMDARYRRIREAAANADEGLRLAEAIGLDNLAAGHLALVARVAAFRGQEDECREAAEEALRRATARGLGMISGWATTALAELELSSGRPDAALLHLDALARADVHPALRLTSVPDLVEASVRAGHGACDHTALDELRRWATGAAPPVLPLVARCDALLSPDDADRHFREALELHDRFPNPFDRARTELLYGEHLRRRGRRVEARAQLRPALTTFEGAGAGAWAERARAELRASGETARRGDGAARDELTPQELRIAELVSTGASNRDVGAQLFLSPKTVEYHLRKVFVKLGISSRTELARIALGA